MTSWWRTKRDRSRSDGRVAFAVAVALGITVATASTAAAVSGGGYQPQKQGCSKRADSNSFQGAEKGCHNANLLIGDGKGHYYVQAGINQEPQHQNAHAGDVTVSPNGGAHPDGTYSGGGATINFDTHWQPIPAGQCGLEDIALYGAEILLYEAGQSGKPCTLDPTKWQPPGGAPTVSENVTPADPNDGVVGLASGFSVYFGADDNLDTGEHDGVNGLYGSGGAANGPSDGGALVFNWHPTQVPAWADALVAAFKTQKFAPIAENPFPVADGGGGACADGFCFSAQTKQRYVYHGRSSSKSSRNVYDYRGKTWGPYDCNSGDTASEKACITEGHHPMTWYRNQEARNVSAEPGVQIYEDPDPQGSPALPIYPLPAVYVGTCGVVLGGGAVQAPASPITNSAGQIFIDPAGC